MMMQKHLSRSQKTLAYRPRMKITLVTKLKAMMEKWLLLLKLHGLIDELVL